MILNYLTRGLPMAGCMNSPGNAETILFGAGLDDTASFRSGQRFGPPAIRAQAQYSQETYSPYFQQDLSKCRVHDAGDIELPIGSTQASLERIHGVTAQILTSGKRPCMLGGEHLVSLPAIEATAAAFPGLHIIQIDAHLDLADELFGNRLSHGTVMRRSLERLGNNGVLWQAGIRSGSWEEYEFAARNTRLFQFDLKDCINELPALSGIPVYLTIDLDVFDPSLMPGTGTPEAGGIFFPEMIAFFKAIQSLNVVACDLVELSPEIDPTGQSTIVAAKVLRELLIAITAID